MTTPEPGRFHVTLHASGRPLQHGWWAREGTARAKLVRWIGEYGSLPDARLTLDDEETGSRLTSWPAQP